VRAVVVLSKHHAKQVRSFVVSIATTYITITITSTTASINIIIITGIITEFVGRCQTTALLP
jgi:hypothetical protein